MKAWRWAGRVLCLALALLALTAGVASAAAPQAPFVGSWEAIDGDFDGDGDVDGRDFLVWQRNSAVGDLADWQANYGTPASLAAGNTAVPEPGACLLLTLGLLTSALRWSDGRR